MSRAQKRKKFRNKSDKVGRPGVSPWIFTNWAKKDFPLAGGFQIINMDENFRESYNYHFYINYRALIFSKLMVS